MNYLKVWQRSVDADFVNRVKVALVEAAIGIASEKPVVPNHANRVAQARAVLMDPDGHARRCALGVATDAAVQEQPGNDQLIANAVQAQWNAYAGVAVEAAEELVALAASVQEPVVAKRSLFDFLKKGQA
jgi:hypothetical protein